MKILWALLNVGLVITFLLKVTLKQESIVMLLPNSTHRECSTQRDCNINIKLNHKILIKFHNLKNYDSHLIMPELGKFNFKTNMIPNRF